MSDAELLVRDNWKLAFWVVKKYFPQLSYQQQDESNADALLGLWTAATRYDPSRGVKFDTFATYVIWRHVANGFRREAYRRKNVPTVSATLDRKGRSSRYWTDMFCGMSKEETPITETVEQRDYAEWVRSLMTDEERELMEQVADSSIAAVARKTGTGGKVTTAVRRIRRRILKAVG